MNLTGNLKDKVERAETMEEKKNIIADAGVELTDEELEGVAGGTSKSIRYRVDCKYCGKIAGDMREDDAIICMNQHEIKYFHMHKCLMTRE